ncbi:hypothetical protein [Eubacterium pyruvativorans]|nr:hypothetical protein [Eubacterium pyruvativorans]
MKLAEIGERTKPFQEGGTLAVITDENVAPHPRAARCIWNC